ncbi:MAG: hypothetical protein PQJ28_02590, partial [Spirochaetales bacterium]|nr:hypothetical protein [Spirochaetales bacterium]
MSCKVVSGFDDFEIGVEVYIYGSGKAAKVLYIDMKQFRPDVKVKAFVDSFKTDGTLYSVPIVNVADVEGPNEQIFIIASMYYDEIGRNLTELGVDDFYVYRES